MSWCKIFWSKEAAVCGSPSNLSSLKRSGLLVLRGERSFVDIKAPTKNYYSHITNIIRSFVESKSVFFWFTFFHSFFFVNVYTRLLLKCLSCFTNIFLMALFVILWNMNRERTSLWLVVELFDVSFPAHYSTSFWVLCSKSSENSSGFSTKYNKITNWWI